MSTSTGTPTPTSAAAFGHSGRLRLRVEQRAGRAVVTRAEGHVPYAARIVPGRPGWARVALVQTIAGPLAGDRFVLEVELGSGAALELTTNAATLAFPAATPAFHKFCCEVGAGARLAWLPQPLVLAAGCDLVASVDLELAAGAAAVTREIVVLGRHGEQAGSYQARLRCDVEGAPLLRDAVKIDHDGIAAESFAVLAGARTFGSLALLGLRTEEPADRDELALAGPGSVFRALAPDTASLAARTAPVEAAYLRALAAPHDGGSGTRGAGDPGGHRIRSAS
jgi:urease accessory protein